MYWGITAASLLALSTLLMGALVLEGVRDTLCRPTRWGPNQATLSTMQQLANQVHTVEQKASPALTAVFTLMHNQSEWQLRQT